ncbi:hypothetical protein BaRGS_00034417 [Batillaria attramentaria]|uniref:C1q domain-containing protein n=1 Tax=Batillaria attramentaria TaxID=370345 RepID=A0ABD0JHI0_9CAEN
MNRWHVFLLAVGICVSGLGVDKRSDGLDLQALLTLIHQQTDTITKMQAELTALKNSVNECRHVSSYIVNQGKLAFTAHMSGANVNVGSTPFIFDVVTTNIGNGYNHQTGTFTAPYRGVYAFFVNVLNHRDYDYIHVAIEKNGQVLAVTLAETHEDAFDKGSAMATTRMQQGDQVVVRRVDGANEIRGEPTTMFSGFLVSPDA